MTQRRALVSERCVVGMLFRTKHHVHATPDGILAADIGWVAIHASMRAIISGVMRMVMRSCNVSEAPQIIRPQAVVEGYTLASRMARRFHADGHGKNAGAVRWTGSVEGRPNRGSFGAIRR